MRLNTDMQAYNEGSPNRGHLNIPRDFAQLNDVSDDVLLG